MSGRIIFHMAPAERWGAWPAHEPYVPAEFAVDGFVHCTEGEELMAQVANALYRKTPGDFVLLVVDVDRLTVPVPTWRRSSRTSTDLSIQRLSLRRGASAATLMVRFCYNQRIIRQGNDDG